MRRTNKQADYLPLKFIPPPFHFAVGTASRHAKRSLFGSTASLRSRRAPYCLRLCVIRGACTIITRSTTTRARSLWMPLLPLTSSWRRSPTATPSTTHVLQRRHARRLHAACNACTRRLATGLALRRRLVFRKRHLSRETSNKQMKALSQNYSMSGLTSRTCGENEGRSCAVAVSCMCL